MNQRVGRCPLVLDKPDAEFAEIRKVVVAGLGRCAGVHQIPEKNLNPMRVDVCQLLEIARWNGALHFSTAEDVVGLCERTANAARYLLDVLVVQLSRFQALFKIVDVFRKRSFPMLGKRVPFLAGDAHDNPFLQILGQTVVCVALLPLPFALRILVADIPFERLDGAALPVFMEAGLDEPALALEADVGKAGL
ncbi:MAG: hypothetical protein ACLQNE_00290 [Thermoguttaceae bacterium]